MIEIANQVRQFAKMAKGLEQFIENADRLNHIEALEAETKARCQALVDEVEAKRAEVEEYRVRVLAEAEEVTAKAAAASQAADDRAKEISARAKEEAESLMASVSHLVDDTKAEALAIRTASEQDVATASEALHRLIEQTKAQEEKLAIIRATIAELVKG